MLILATLFWGMGFSWSKNVGDTINRSAGLPTTATLGPMTGLAIRLGVATVLWFAVSRDCWRGWTWPTLRRGGLLGFSFSLGLILQHIGLGLSDEAVIAFLTNLTVVFVPAWVLIATQTWPRRQVLIAVPVALAGMALLSGVRGFGAGGSATGVVWGVGCAAAFAVALLMLDRFGKQDSAGKLTLMLFVSAAVSSLGIAVFLPGFGEIRWRQLATVEFLSDMGPAVVLTTVIAFGLMTMYQPMVDPTKATLLYLCEPLFAAAFAWWLNGRVMSSEAMIGAALILSANLIAEWRGKRV